MPRNSRAFTPPRSADRTGPIVAEPSVCPLPSMKVAARVALSSWPSYPPSQPERVKPSRPVSIWVAPPDTSIGCEAVLEAVFGPPTK